MSRALDAHPLLVVALVALGARLVVASAIRLRTGGFLFGDDVYFARLATDLAHGDTTDWIPHDHGVYGRMRAFLVPLTLLYRVFGEHSFTGQLLVVLFGVGAAVLTTRLAMEWLSRRWAVSAGFVVALLPSQILFSSLTLRDAESWLLLAGVGVLVSVANRSRGLVLATVLGLAALILGLLGLLRLHTFVVAVWAAGVASLFGSREGRVLRSATLFLLVLLLPVAFGMGPGGVGFLTTMGALDDRRAAGAVGAETAVVEPTITASDARTRQELADGLVRVYFPDGRVREVLTDGRVREYAPGGSVREIRPDGVTRRLPPSPAPTPPAEIARHLRDLRRAQAEWSGEHPRGLSYLPVGLVVYLLEPLPWRMGGTAVLLAKLETLLWYPLLLLGLFGAAVMVRRLRGCAGFPVLVAGGLSVGYGMAEGNFGTAYRHRGEIVWAVAVAAATGAQWLWARYAPHSKVDER